MFSIFRQSDIQFLTINMVVHKVEYLLINVLVVFDG